MILALSSVISSWSLALFKVPTLMPVISLQALTLPCLALNNECSVLASASLSFTYGVLKSIIFFTFIAYEIVVDFVGDVKLLNKFSKQNNLLKIFKYLF